MISAGDIRTCTFLRMGPPVARMLLLPVESSIDSKICGFDIMLLRRCLRAFKLDLCVQNRRLGR